MKITTFGPVSTSIPELRAKAEAAAKEAGADIKLTVLYLPLHADYKQVIGELKGVSKAPLIGCTTGGAGFTERGFTTDGVVGAFFSGEDLAVSTFCMKDLKKNYEESIGKGMAGLQPGELPGHSLFVLSDYAGIDGERFLESIKQKISITWKCFGGFAGDNWSFSGAKIFYDGDVFDGGAVAAYINSPAKSGIGVKHGFVPLENSQSFKITAIESNVLKELDGRPALDVYTEELSKAGLLSKGDDVMKKAASFPIGVKTIFGEGLKIRTPLSIEGKSLVLAGSIPLGSTVRIVSGETSALLAAARELKQTALGDLGKAEIIGQMVIDCGGRFQLLGSKYAEEVENLKVNETSPMLGFTSYGEFAKFGVSFIGFHNTTTVSCFW